MTREPFIDKDGCDFVSTQRKGRRVGVGFNYPRVLERTPADVPRKWWLMRQMARLNKNRRPPWQVGISAVEVHRSIVKDA